FRYQWHICKNGAACIAAGLNAKSSAEFGKSLLHAENSYTLTARFKIGESLTVIAYFELKFFGRDTYAEDDVRCFRVPMDIGKRFLRHAKDGRRCGRRKIRKLVGHFEPSLNSGALLETFSEPSN